MLIFHAQGRTQNMKPIRGLALAALCTTAVTTPAQASTWPE